MAHAPVLDYLRSTLRGHRAAGTVHLDVAQALDGYLGHVIRLAGNGEISGPEALTAANAALKAALAVPVLPEARLAPRGRP